jgi:hypothetical protein
MASAENYYTGDNLFSIRRSGWKGGPQASIDRLLSGKTREGVSADFERVAGLLADAAVSAGDLARLKAWWVYRMLFGSDLLGERRTFLLYLAGWL